MNSKLLFTYLCERNAQFQVHRRALPRQEFKKIQWLGVGFILSGNHFAAPLAELSEIVNTPRLTRIPGVPSWLRGVMNLRGRLVPVYDLEGFLTEEPGSYANKYQVLVIARTDNMSGVVVNKLTGLLRFTDQDWRERPEREESVTAPYINGFYERKSELWRIFSMKQFVEERAKMQIGVDLNG